MTNLPGMTIRRPVSILSGRDKMVLYWLGQKLEREEVARRANMSTPAIDKIRECIQERIGITTAKEFSRYAEQWAAHCGPGYRTDRQGTEGVPIEDIRRVPKGIRYELPVLELLGQGVTRRAEIARRLQVEMRTVHKHLKTLKSEYGCRTFTDLCQKAALLVRDKRLPT